MAGICEMETLFCRNHFFAFGRGYFYVWLASLNVVLPLEGDSDPVKDTKTGLQRNPLHFTSILRQYIWD